MLSRVTTNGGIGGKPLCLRDGDRIPGTPDRRPSRSGPASGASKQDTMPELQPDASLPGHTFTVEACRSRRWPPRMLYCDPSCKPTRDRPVTPSRSRPCSLTQCSLSWLGQCVQHIHSRCADGHRYAAYCRDRSLRYPPSASSHPRSVDRVQGRLIVDDTHLVAVQWLALRAHCAAAAASCGRSSYATKMVEPCVVSVMPLPWLIRTPQSVR
jgi:hypothetical protein